jgi:glycerophosphoryl diester phosphodiesterase
MRRTFKRVGIAIGVLLALMIAYIVFPWPIPPASDFTVVAHRGVHHTFPLDNLTYDTCTGEIIDPPTHGWIENTLPSMAEAFARGADMVEIDIHRTADDHLIVFHDWTVDCRTDGTGQTNELTLAYLKSLDVGYGYTADGGATFPLRGQGVGMMPTLAEVLAAFPEQQFVIHNKDGAGETRRLLTEFLKTLTPEQRSRLYYWGEEFALVQADAPEVRPYIFSTAGVDACVGEYLFRMLTVGRLSDACRGQIIGVPYARLGFVPGWPNLIIARARQAGAKVFVADVDTPEQLERVRAWSLDGIQTNRIEVIGPLVNEQ